MYGELKSQIFAFVMHSPESDEEQFMALLHGRMGSGASHVAAAILGAGFEGQRWNLGSGPDSAVLTAVTSFAELCVVNNHSHLLRTVVEFGPPACLADLALDQTEWLKYVCRTRRPDEPRELPGDEFIESSLFVLATNSTESGNGSAARSVFDSVCASNVLEALRLALEFLPGDAGCEIARTRNSVSRALLANAEMSMSVAPEPTLHVAPKARRRLAL